MVIYKTFGLKKENKLKDKENKLVITLLKLNLNRDDFRRG